MKITSTSFADGDRIPGRNAFGIPADDAPMQFGPNENPHLAWTDAPEGTQSFALLCIDPDVPSVGDDVNQPGKVIPADLPRVDFCHCVIIDIPANVSEIAEGACSQGVVVGGKNAPTGPDGARQGVNDYTSFFAEDPDLSGIYLGYDGPCPPFNDERLHHYDFILLALDIPKCVVEDPFTVIDVITAVEGHILGRAKITGTYALNPSVS